MKILYFVFLLTLFITELKGQDYYINCQTSESTLPFNNDFDSINEYDFSVDKHKFNLAVRLTVNEIQTVLKEKRLPIHSYKLVLNPNSDFTNFEIEAFSRNYVRNKITNPNVAFEIGQNSDKGIFTNKELTNSISINSVFDTKFNDLTKNLDQQKFKGLVKLIEWYFKQSITNYTEVEKVDSINYQFFNSTYLKYSENKEIHFFQLYFSMLISNANIPLYISPLANSRKLKPYERTHDIDTLTGINYNTISTSERPQIGFKLYETFKAQYNQPGKPLSISKELTFVGIVFKTKQNISETAWIKISDLENYQKESGVSHFLPSLKNIIRQRTESLLVKPF